jgi:MFS family permease
MDKRERNLLLSTCYGHFMSHFNMLVFPAIVLPMTIALNMEIGRVIGLSFWMYLLFGLTSLPWGMLADIWSPRLLFILYYTGAGISGLCAGLWIDQPELFATALAGIGLFSGIYHPLGLGLVSKEIKDVSIGMGFNGMFGNLGLAIAPLLAGVCTWLKGPGAAYFLLGLMNISGLILILSLPRLNSEHKKYEKSDYGQSMVKPFVILLVIMMLAGIAYRGATLIVPAYFELKTEAIFSWLSDDINMNISENLAATLIISFIYLVGIPGQYLGGKVAQRFNLKLCYLIFNAITVPAVFLMAITTDIPLFILTVVYFFFLLGMQPIENTLLTMFTPRRLLHSAYGFKFILSFGVGSFAVFMVSGIQKHLCIEAVFPALGIVSVFLIMGIILLIKISGKMELN